MAASIHDSRLNEVADGSHRTSITELQGDWNPCRPRKRETEPKLQIFPPNPKRLIQFRAPLEVVGAEQNPASDSFGDFRHYDSEVANAGDLPGSRDMFNGLQDRRAEFRGRSSAEDWLQCCTQTTVPLS